ncbi:MAG: exo-alpha-sialidase [Clostridia bacterium]|nr:exo-alpha-sialidase [Clostridia bacterium]
MQEITKRVIEQSLRGFDKDEAKKPCRLLYRPRDEKYAESIRQFQGCPTVSVTRGGRIYLGWYAGGEREPDMENYNLLVYSDDNGETFSEPLLVIPSEPDRGVHALDIQTWIAPSGALWVFWVQNNALRATEALSPLCGAQADHRIVVQFGDWIYPDLRHAAYFSVCEDPDAKDPVFSEPRNFDIGFLRCKPLVLSSGRWLLCNYDQLTDTYGYSFSDDAGKHFERRYGAGKIPTPYDETMAYERRDGSIRMLARTVDGTLAETVSRDGGLSFSDAVSTGIPSPNTRFYIGRTPSGRILLVNNDDREVRSKMTVYLSEDDGATFPYKRRVGDETHLTSYPDVDFYGGKIYLTFDHERTGAREILLSVFTEEDVMADTDVPIPAKIISKPNA